MTEARPPVRGRGFAPLRDLPAIGWLGAAAIAAAAHPFLSVPRWLLIHLVVLGAASHSILVWSQFFADTLLHTASRPGDRAGQNLRIGILNVGAVLVVLGVLHAWAPVIVVGSSGVAAAAGWHAFSLHRQLRRALSARFAMIVRYYVAAAALLPLGALLGTLMATGRGEQDPGMLVAHVVTNVLGWLGISVAGTVVTLWPTALRTRLVAGAERAATRALPFLVGGVLLSVAMSLVGMRAGAVAGLVVYLGGLGLLADPFVRSLRAKPASDIATWSLLAGLAWFVAVVVFLAVDLTTAGTWEQAHDRLAWVTPAVAAGFAAQMLVGAMSYLLPVALGGGPSLTRQTNAAMGLGGPARIVLVNGGLLLAVLPSPPTVRALGWALVVVGLAAFLVLALAIGPLARRAKAVLTAAHDAAPGRPAAAPTPIGERTRAWAVTGLAVVALVVTVGVAAGPAAPASQHGSLQRMVSTGATTTVTVTAKDMRFTPSTVTVPAGNRLVVTVRNADPTTSHDLTFASGARTGLLAPGATGRVDVGVVTADLQGWCSVPGHRQLGMVLAVLVTGEGAGPEGGQTTPSGSAAGPAGAGRLVDLSRSPGPGFTAYPAVLAPAPSGTVHRVRLTVEDVVREVAPGVRQLMWTYDGAVPGPILHGRVGDTFEITLVNRSPMGHSIDFHAGQVAPGPVMRTIGPGGTLLYRFTATHAGVWMYHCSTGPMSVHIANGMFGAVIIDPPGLDRVDREYVLIQSELYLGSQAGPVDADKVRAQRPDLVVFNGYADQYDARPLSARVGERVRIWVLDAGPDRATSFHVVGAAFDTVYAEGAYLLRPGPAAGGSQALGLQVAQGGFVELSFTQPGRYPFVSHVMVDAERGAHGVIDVTG